jgi:hypothetical protein
MKRPGRGLKPVLSVTGFMTERAFSWSAKGAVMPWFIPRQTAKPGCAVQRFPDAGRVRDLFFTTPCYCADRMRFSGRV